MGRYENTKKIKKNNKKYYQTTILIEVFQMLY